MPEFTAVDEQSLPGFAPMFTMPEEPEAESPVTAALNEVQSDFDPRHREDFTGLLYLGRLEEECSIAGHKFLLVTPGHRERLSLGPLHKPYLNTISGERAWMSIVVAAYLRRIDSQDAPEPLSPAQDPVRLRFEWLLDNIYSDHITEQIYDRCMLLDARVRTLTEELDRLGEASA